VNPVEAIIQALKLAILTVGFILEEARKAESAKADAVAKRAQFETAVARALERMRGDGAKELQQINTIDDAMDAEEKENHHIVKRS
jgi:hypothetical protein